MAGTNRTQISSKPGMVAQPVVILADPQMGENIGAAARAMLNCGLMHLRLVRPRDGWPNEKADAMSAGALEVFPPVRVFDTVAEAAADLNYIYATTARPRGMVKPVFTARAAAEDMKARVLQGQTVGFLFGAERTGLTNDDVALAHAVITIPLNPAFSSLNLGQAVLLTTYEWAQAVGDAETPGVPPIPENTPAPHAVTNELVERLEAELDAHGFFRTPEQKPTTARNLRNMIMRAAPTDQEVRTFHGIISALTVTKKY